MDGDTTQLLTGTALALLLALGALLVRWLVARLDACEGRERELEQRLIEHRLLEATRRDERGEGRDEP